MATILGTAMFLKPQWDAQLVKLLLVLVVDTSTTSINGNLTSNLK